MTKLPPPEQWVLSKMSEMEVAEMIEEHIDYYTVDKDGTCRSVHLPTSFVRHFMKRSDPFLPTVVAVATSPIVLADGELLAPDGLDRLRGIQFLIQDELRAVMPQGQDCTPERVKAAIEFLCDKWLVDVATDYVGKATIIAAALTLIERSLLPDRPCFFVTAGRRGGGKTTTLIMLITAVTGLRPAAAAWSKNEEERRKALLSYFLYGMAYILWDNIERGTQISCPHIEKSCTSAYYSDRKLGVSEAVCTAASTIHFFTGNNIGPKGDMASRSLHIRLDVDRADPENREFKHPDPIGWTENHRAEILAALYTILLGNPQLKTPRDAEGKTRFKMWWRLAGSAVEHAAGLCGRELDFQKLFITQEEDDEDSTTLADVLEVFLAMCPGEFIAKDVAELVNDSQFGGFVSDAEETSNKKLVRDFLLPGAPNDNLISTKSIGRRLRRHLDNAVLSDNGDMLVLRKREGSGKAVFYRVDRKVAGASDAPPKPEDGDGTELARGVAELLSPTWRGRRPKG